MRLLEKAEGIVGADKTRLEELRDLINRFLTGADVLLFGSVARGTANSESDYDILVLAESPVNRPGCPPAGALF